MTREESIKWLKEMLNKYVISDPYYVAIDMAIKALDQPEQCETKEQNQSDSLLSGQSNKCKKQACMLERREDIPDTNVGTIDNPESPAKLVYDLAEKIGIHQLYALAVELRGEPEPCEDAVSRQVAIDELPYLLDYDGLKGENGFVSKRLVRKMLKELPSAEPKRKTGRWITQEFGSWAECSECHELYDIPIAYSNFCPNCGAEMEG